MTLLTDLIDRIRAFEANLFSFIENAIKSDEAYILDMNTFRLNDEGKDRFDKPIEPPYTAFTVSIKTQKGQPTNRVTLKDEGDFHASFVIQYIDEGFKIWATDWKTKKLVEAYGDTIFGLTDANLQEVIDTAIKPYLLKEINQL